MMKRKLTLLLAATLPLLGMQAQKQTDKNPPVKAAGKEGPRKPTVPQQGFSERLKAAESAYYDHSYSTSFPQLLQLSEEGCTGAYGMLARSYELGWGTDADKERAVYWYEQNLESGNDRFACYCYGLILKEREDYAKARKAFARCMQGNDFHWGFEAAYNLGVLYESGVGGPRDVDAAVACFRKAVRSNSFTTGDKAAKALKGLGYSIYEKSDFKEPTTQMLVSKTAAELFDDGYNYYEGRGAKPKDMAKAYLYFKASAAKEYYKAYRYLGHMYNDKDLPIYDKTQSDAYFLKYRTALKKLIDSNGDREYYECMGDIYRNAWGVTTDYDEAIRWYRPAAEKGGQSAQLWLGQLLKKQGSYAEALKWLETSGRSGQGWAACLAGEMYEKGCNGTGANKINPNLEKAIELYRLSAATTNYYARDAKAALRRLGVPEK